MRLMDEIRAVWNGGGDIGRWDYVKQEVRHWWRLRVVYWVEDRGIEWRRFLQDCRIRLRGMLWRMAGAVDRKVIDKCHCKYPMTDPCAADCHGRKQWGRMVADRYVDEPRRRDEDGKWIGNMEYWRRYHARRKEEGE